MNEFIPGDVEILEFTITPLSGGSGRLGGGSYNLIPQTVSIDIYESLMNPFMYAEIVISDAIDLLRSLPIITEEKIKLRMRIPGTSAQSEYNFVVKRVTNVAPNEMLTSKSYVLSCVTEDYINSASTLVNEAYEQEIDRTVRAILTDDQYIGTKKTLVTEPTKGVGKLLITRKQPFEAIDMLRRRAVSQTNETSSYCFFENKKGYFFVTMEKLFTENSKNVSSDRTFRFSTAARADFTTSLYRNIIGYEQVISSDAIDKLQNGGLNNRVISVDFATGAIKEINFTRDLDSNITRRTIQGNHEQNTQTFKNRYGKEISKIMLVPFNSFEDDNELPQKISTMHAYAMKVAQNISRINIWGDCDITCGDVIKCYLPSGSQEYDSGKENQLDRLSRDNFLISKIKHSIQMGGRPIYTQAMEIINGSMFEPVGG